MPGPYGPGRSGEGNEPVRYVVVTGPGHVPDHAPRRVHRQAAVGRMMHVGPGHEGMTSAARRGARLFRGHPVAPLHDHPSDLGGKLRRGERHAVHQTPVFVSVSAPFPRAVARPPAFAGSGCVGSPVPEAGRNRTRDPASRPPAPGWSTVPSPACRPGSPDSRFRVPSSPQGSWRPIRIAGMSSLDFTVGLIFGMSGASNLRRVSWTLRMGAS